MITASLHNTFNHMRVPTKEPVPISDYQNAILHGISEYALTILDENKDTLPESEHKALFAGIINGINVSLASERDTRAFHVTGTSATTQEEDDHISYKLSISLRRVGMSNRNITLSARLRRQPLCA